MESDLRVGTGSRGGRRWVFGLCVGAALALGGTARSALAADTSQEDFATAEQAVDALIGAMRRGDQPQLLQVLGPDGEKLIHSGDAIADQRGRERFVSAYDKAHRIEVDKAGTATLVVGSESWPMPIPVVKQGDRWRFDTVASVQKILDRRVGRNELSVIQVCRAYVSAQREFASESWNGAHEYAQKFESSAGQHDGLYWEAPAGQPQSPLGPLMAKARAQGYGTDHAFQPLPYHGYLYRILTRQGARAPGGAKDYLVSGHMTAGFALLAFPARWGDSGIMTFVVNQDGIVFQKNLGPDTEKLAADIDEYNPDPSWTTP
jgi:hypothetical protein